VGAAVKIGIVDRATKTTTIGWWTPPFCRICKRRDDVGRYPPLPLSPVCTRTMDVSKYRLDLEVDGGSGGCWGRSEILTRPGNGWKKRWM